MNQKHEKLKRIYYSILFVFVCLCIVIGIYSQSATSVIIAVFGVALLGLQWFLFFREKKDEIESTVIKEGRTLQESIVLPEHMPFPYILLDESYTIVSYNHFFKELFKKEKILTIPLDELLPAFKKNTASQKLSVGKAQYAIYMRKLVYPLEEARQMYAVWLLDVTDSLITEHQMQMQKTVIALIFIDNYEEVLESMDDAAVPLLTALIDRKLNAYATQFQGIVRKYEKDRYLFLFDQASLEKMKERKFDIMNEIRDIHIGEHIPVTLSIGIGINNDGLHEEMKSAKSAIDLALGRGGDQVLIKEGEKYSFFGGKSGEVSHNARIRARVKADALSELMTESDLILVMGHRQADLDSLGSAIGVYRIARALGKDCFIVLDTISVGVRRLYERLVDGGGEYETAFISGAKAEEKIGNKTLLVITDTHRRSIVECPSLLDHVKKLVIFDHHRKSTDFIENAVLVYHEPYASSTCELITEMIQYIGEKIKLKTVEADALLAGITVDTKSFCVKTGAITFEAAAYLRRNGADSIRVRLLFQNDMEAYKAKATAVKDAEIFEDNIAISVCPSHVENSSLTAAQAADDLLNVAGIKASFVLCQVGATIYISARSLGDVNVQVILEKMGGGGHQTVAGVQITDQDIDRTKEQLQKVILEYLQEVE